MTDAKDFLLVSNAFEEQTMQMVMDNMELLVFWKNKDMEFLGCNKHFASYIGLSCPTEIKGKTDYDISITKDADEFREIDKEVMKTKVSHISVMQKQPDEKSWWRVTKMPLQNSQGNVMGVIGILQDITDEILSQKMLEANSEKYKKMIESTNTAYMILDYNFKIIESNQIFADLMDCDDPKELIGKDPHNWITAEFQSSIGSALYSLKQGEIINNLELSMVNDKGSNLWINMNASLIENGGKNIFCLVRDISKRKQSEIKKYIHSQKQKDKMRQSIVQMRSQIKQIQTP